MTRTQGTKRDVAELRALDAAGGLVESLTLSLEDYYESRHGLIDSDEHRAARGVRQLEGELYSATGAIFQRFRNRYSESGAYVGGRTEYGDGTVSED